MSDVVHEENEGIHEVLHEVWMPLHEAAETLGISPRAVQLRAEKGKIRRDRQDGRVVFCVAASRSVHVENEVPEAALHEESEVLHEADTQQVDVATYIVHLENEVQFLREQVQTHQTNEAELRRLMLADKHELSTLREKVQLLLAATPVEEPSGSPQEAHTATLQAHTENLAPETETGAQRSHKWWKFWKRGKP